MRISALSFILISLFCYGVYGIYLGSWTSPASLGPISEPPLNLPKFYDYSGLMNVRFSRNKVDLENLLKAAEATKSSFIFLTSPDGEDIPEGYQGSIYVFSGSSQSYLNAQILNFNTSRHSDSTNPNSTNNFSRQGRSQMFLGELLRDKNRDKNYGSFILAHPLRPGYKLQESFPEGIDGIEVINLRSIWQTGWSKSKGVALWSSLFFPFNTTLFYLRFLSQSIREELRYWDKILITKPTYAVAGTDAKNTIQLTKEKHLEIISHKELFGLAKNHILIKSELTGESEKDRRKILEAVQNGNLYFSFDFLSDPTGFSAIVQNNVKTSAPYHLPGSRIALAPNLELAILLPFRPAVPYRVSIYKNGEKILNSTSTNTQFPIVLPGIYRVEVELRIRLPFPEGSRWMPWIVSNPFYVTG
jgi:hypothetical protein